MRRTILFLLLPLAAVAIAADPPAANRPVGYLPPHSVDLLSVVPPAPVEGDIRYEADRDVFRDMKPMIGGPRWKLATNDVDYATPALLADFSCAAGARLTPGDYPATTHLLERAAADTSVANNDSKNHYKRPRPYKIDDGETCQAKEDLGDSFDYPSGHTTAGWTYGLVLAELMPERATPILARARAYGESRIVCRVHTMSAVESGRLGATATMMSVRAAPGYQADLAAARRELAARRSKATAPDPATCQATEPLVTHSVLEGLK